MLNILLILVPKYLWMAGRKGVQRLSHWTDEKIQIAFLLSLAGFTEVQMAEIMEVPYVTFKLWKKNHPQFLQALHDGKLGANTKVVEAALQVCLGYEYDKEIATYDRSTKDYVRTTIKEKVPPNPWAIFKWMNMRMREQGWSETQRLVVDHNTNINIDIQGLSTEFLKMIETEAQKQLPQNAGDNA